ncbi:MAG: GEVED domain-containing protein, partial [Chlorobi bacterium]|nr:GEVED domain-containing protein [Chlorobiota bacterium]
MMSVQQLLARGLGIICTLVIVPTAVAQLGSNVCSPNASSYGCMSIMSFGVSGSTTWTNSASYPNCGAAYTGTGTNSNHTFNAAAGQTLSWSCTAGNYYGSYYDGYLFIWVDWNNDGDFFDAGEQMTSYWYIYQSTSGSFTVPSGASMGPKRMRVLFGYWYYVDYVYYSAANHPCAGNSTTYYNYGDFRDFTLNIIANNDAGAVNVTTSSPPPFPPGNNTVQAVIRNYGGNTISSVTVNWSVNGVTQTPVQWTGSLPSGQQTTVNLGQFNFPQVGALQVQAWTSNPNGVTDPVPSNDASPVRLFGAALSGTYTIGGTNPDFPTVISAANQLTAGGTLGAVTFNIRPGTYTGYVYIANPPGNQQSRPIVFQSENSVAGSVIIQHSGGTTQTAPLNETGVSPTSGEPTVRLLNADFVTFKNVTISATGTGGS